MERIHYSEERHPVNLQDLSGIDTGLQSQEEKRQLLFDFNENQVEFPYDKTIVHFIEDHAVKTPDTIGLVYGSSQLTYRQLNERANRLAWYLRDIGVGEDQTLGLLLDRSLQMVESILALWKAGGAYIPLETDYPAARILEIMNDSESPVLLSSRETVDPAVQESYHGKVIDPGLELELRAGNRSIENLNLEINMTGLAYVIYTSGSTGKPKGAMVEHIGMMNHIRAKINDLQMTGQSIAAQNASHCFDISVWQFFATLVVGGRTVIYSHESILEPGYFISLLTRHRITILEVVPSYLSIILAVLDTVKPIPLPFHYLLVTGEEVKPHLVRNWFARYPHIKMVNAYGPTEASDDITHYIMNKAPETEPIPIGKPIQNFIISILDENNNPCPIGVKGEIVVSGMGVGRGYLNNPELTAEKFANHHQSHDNKKFLRGSRGQFLQKAPPGRRRQKRYKTGDLACWMADKNILFFGRMDHQVKIRGFRIELGEIERRLLNNKQIKDAVVIDSENAQGNKYLCAYLVGAGKKLNLSEIKASLAEQLPDYMVPSYFVELESLPLTANGKIDRKALPKPKIGSQALIPYLTVEKLNRIAVRGEPGKSKQSHAKVLPGDESQATPLSKEEIEKILFSFNTTQTTYQSNKTLRNLVEEQVEKRPHKIILAFADRQITYARLNSEAEQLAMKLRRRGIQRDSIAGLMVERSINWIVAILGIVKAGGAYLPIGMEFPEERRKFMLTDSQAEIILVNKSKDIENLRKQGFSARIIDISRDGKAGEESSGGIHLEPVQDRSSDLVYVMYTSGTTGTPKAVMIQNRSLVNLIKGLTDIIDFNEKETILSLSTVSFDIVVEETLLTLTQATKIVIGNTYQQSVPSAAGLIMQKERVTLLKVTPAMMWLYVSDKEALKGLKGLKHVMLGGEALPEALLEKMRRCTKARIYNTYGPTETTAVSTVKDVTSQALDIGSPIANTQIYILGPQDCIQPVGTAGEICIGGDGVARGYLNNPELTSQKFCLRRPGGLFSRKLPPWTPRKSFLLRKRGNLPGRYVFYRTGDLGKWLPTGDIEFIGRKDQQVQIRGLRIEPGEIESVLLSHDDVKEAVVVVKEDENNEKYLSACITSPERLLEEDLKEYLAKELPHYMIPLSFFQLEEIPLLPNKKTNRKLLQAITLEKKSQHDIPGNEVEKKLAEIWAEILGIDKNLINMDADFFQLGGDSILCLQMVLKAREAGINISSLQVFQYPNLQDLTARIKSKNQKKQATFVPADKDRPLLEQEEREELIADNPGTQDVYPLTPIQQQTLSYNLLTTETSTTIHQLSWFMTGDLNIPAFRKAWQTVTQRHCILRTAFKRRRLNAPLQLLFSPVNIPFLQVDCSGMTDMEQKHKIQDYINSDKKQRFKMAQAPLMRLCLFILPNRLYRFICSYSSLLLDNWSSTIMVKEVFLFYNSYINSQEQLPSPPKPQPFADYVKWLMDNDHSQARHFWSCELAGFDSPLDMGRYRLTQESFNSGFSPAVQNTRLSGQYSTQLLALAKKYRLTSGTLLQGAWVITLSYFSKEDDILSAVLSYGRPDEVAGIESMVGLFINTIPVRMKVPPQQDLISWLKEFQDKQAGLRQFDYISIENISNWSAIPLEKIQKAIYERTFVLVKSPDDEFFSRLAGNSTLKISQYDDSLIINVPLRLYAELSGDVCIQLKYNRECFLPETIDDMTRYLERLLKNMVDTPGVSLGDLKTKTHTYRRRK